MRSKIQLRIVSNFFLDGAKIIFGSLVIGIFMPSATVPKFPFATLIVGITMTIAFLILANTAAKTDAVADKNIKTNQS